MDIQIRRATLEDRERIGRFLKKAYGERAQYKFPARWRWEYVDNPFWNEDRLPIWLAEMRGEIVGQTGEMIVPLKLGDSVRRAAWGVDLIVLPEHRKKGIGRLLIEALADYHDTFLALTMSPISRGVMASLGFTALNGVTEFGKTVRFDSEGALEALEARLGEGSALVRVSRRLGLGGMIASALNSRARLRDMRGLRELEHRFEIEGIERFGDEITQLWNRLASHFPAIVRRDAVYLNWKFVDQPHMAYEKFVLRQAGGVRGYVITRRGVPPEPSVGVIADVLAAPGDDDVVQALLVHAVNHLKRAGVQSIVAASSWPSYVPHFLRLGFDEVGEAIPMFRCREVHPTDWFLSMGDHDWDQYPLL